MSARARRATRTQLNRLGVDVVDRGRAVEVGERTVSAEIDGQRMVLSSAATILATCFEAPELAADSGLVVDEIGRSRTDATLVAVGDDRIVSAGGCGRGRGHEPADELPGRRAARCSGR